MASIAARRQETSFGERPVHRFTIQQYERMAALGVLTPDDRVELLEGIIVDKMTQHPPHSTAIELTRDALTPVLPNGWRIREQKPIELSDSEPEPDLAIVRGPPKRYAKAHPRPRDIGLVIEVGDTSLEDDRGRKVRVYARARLPWYWIINLIDRQVEVYSEPKTGMTPSYRVRQVYGPEDHVPLIIDGREIARIPVRDLLP